VVIEIDVEAASADYSYLLNLVRAESLVDPQ